MWYMGSIRYIVWIAPMSVMNPSSDCPASPQQFSRLSHATYTQYFKWLALFIVAIVAKRTRDRKKEEERVIEELH